MITAQEYSPSDLESGICMVCQEQSDELIIDEGICTKCIESYYKNYYGTEDEEDERDTL